MIDKNELLARISTFETLPVAAQRLLQIASQPEAGGSQIAEAIALDVALTANVLKAANSAYFGFAKPVTNLEEAVFRLGSGWIFQLAVLTIMSGTIKRPAVGYGQSATDIWRHSVAVAVTADNLCRELRLINTKSVFTAAIVHDIGKLALASYLPEHMDTIQQCVHERQMSFLEAEREQLGVDHAEVGWWIAANWNFPKPLAQAVRWHHDPNNAEDGQPLVDIVHVSDSLCIMQGIGLGIDELSYRICPESVERLNLTSAVIETVTSKLLDSVAGIDQVLTDSSATVKIGG